MKEDQMFSELYRRLVRASQPPTEKLDRLLPIILERLPEYIKEQEGEKQSSRETQNVKQSE